MPQDASKKLGNIANLVHFIPGAQMGSDDGDRLVGAPIRLCPLVRCGIMILKLIWQSGGVVKWIRKSIVLEET